MDTREKRFPLSPVAVLALVLVCLAVCLVLGVGTAWARYQWSEKYELTFQGEPAQLVLTMEDWESEEPEEGVTDQPVVRTAEISLENGTEDAYASGDISFTLELDASLGLGGTEAVSITLTALDAQGGEVEYVGIPQEIPEGSARSMSFGPGWIYRFYTDDSGEQEASFTLEGGTYQIWEATVRVTGDTEYTSLLTLRANQQ